MLSGKDPLTGVTGPGQGGEEYEHERASEWFCSVRVTTRWRVRACIGITNTAPDAQRA